MDIKTNDDILQDFVRSSAKTLMKRKSESRSPKINFSDCKKTRRLPLSVYVKPEILERLELQCNELEVSQSRFVEKVLDLYLGGN